jgi:hypothetical protein
LIWASKHIEPQSCRAPARPATARKDNLVRNFLTGAAIVLALAGTSLAVSAPASAGGFAISVGNDRGHDQGRNRSSSVVSLAFGNVAFGYRDGYWDNGHRWHRWNNDRDYRNYRNHHGGNYRDWNHDRNGGDGWDRDRDRGDHGRGH